MDTAGDWLPGPRQPALAAGEVHLWRVWLDQPAERTAQLARTLSPDEQQRAQTFQFDVDRTRFIVGRGVLRALLGLYLRLEPEQVNLAYGEWGKPALAEPAAPLGFNLAHAAGLALYAFTWGRSIGVDLEAALPLPDMTQLVAQFFSPREQRDWRSLPAAGQCEAFYRCWTRKEAFLKALGAGLARPTEQFSVSLRPDEPAHLLEVAWDPAEAARWTLVSFQPRAGYLAAVAVEGQGTPAWARYHLALAF